MTSALAADLSRPCWSNGRLSDLDDLPFNHMRSDTDQQLPNQCRLITFLSGSDPRSVSHTQATLGNLWSLVRTTSVDSVCEMPETCCLGILILLAELSGRSRMPHYPAMCILQSTWALIGEAPFCIVARLPINFRTLSKRWRRHVCARRLSISNILRPG